MIALASSTHPLNATAVIISVGIPFVICAAIALIVWAYFNLQAHRADAVANAEYRKLAQDAVANQQELRAELTKLTEKVEAVEQLMRDVG
jgi:predicted negative regulator of RcsB-dependent stress response